MEISEGNFYIDTGMVYGKGNSEPSFSLSLHFYTFPYNSKKSELFPWCPFNSPPPPKKKLEKG